MESPKIGSTSSHYKPVRDWEKNIKSGLIRKIDLTILGLAVVGTMVALAFSIHGFAPGHILQPLGNCLLASALGGSFIFAAVDMNKQTKCLNAYLKDPKNKLDDYENLYDKLKAAHLIKLRAKGNFNSVKAELEARDHALIIIKDTWRYIRKLRKRMDKDHKEILPDRISKLFKAQRKNRALVNVVG